MMLGRSIEDWLSKREKKKAALSSKGCVALTCGATWLACSIATPVRFKFNSFNNLSPQGSKK